MTLLRLFVIVLAFSVLAPYLHAGTIAEAATDQVKHMERDLEQVVPGNTIAWGIIGLMVGGLVGSVVSLGHGRRIVHLFAGAIGGVAGGMVSHLAKINMDLGQVTLRYEDVLAAAIVAMVLVILVQIQRVRSIRAKQKREAAKI